MYNQIVAPKDARTLWFRVFTRAFDLMISIVAMLCLSPLLLTVAFAICINSPGPIIFSQPRNGLGGRPFTIYKFRSMIANTDGHQATKNDVRVTEVGAFIRKTSIDELPQLFNVLLGDMSIVGPRPHPLWLDARMVDVIPRYMDRYCLKPGITGLAQVSGHRGETASNGEMEERIKCDLKYVEHRSISMYIKIVIRTFTVIADTESTY